MKLTVYEKPAGDIGADDARLDIVFDRLADAGIDVDRVDMLSAPEAFEANEELSEMIAEDGDSVLPAFYLDDILMADGGYPSTEEIDSWFEFEDPPCAMNCASCGMDCPSKEAE